ncbi:MAG: hypothetical protein RLZZ436_2469, partial [Planctomycetota bacterium]
AQPCPPRPLGGADAAGRVGHQGAEIATGGFRPSAQGLGRVDSGSFGRWFFGRLLCSESVDDDGAGAGEFVHLREQFCGFAERDGVADEQFGVELSVGDHSQHSGVFEGLHPVASQQFKFAADDQAHGNSGIGIGSGHQSHLHVSAAFAEAADGIPAGAATAECIEGNVSAACGELLDGFYGVCEFRVDDVGGSAASSSVETVVADVDGDDLGAEGATDHDSRQTDTAAAMHGQPFSGSGSSLISHGAEGCGEAAAETGGGDVTECVGECDEVDVGMPDLDVFREGAPLSEPGLGVVVADLGMSAAALGAGAAAAAEGDRDSFAGCPEPDIGAHGHDDSCQFMTGHVWEVHIAVVSHPAVPVAAAEAAAFDLEHRGIRPG